MEIVFVRHGVPDYSLADERQMSQLEKDYSPLARAGIGDIETLSHDPVFAGATVIISSPYTRALQTAELLNRSYGLDLFVEHDLREWQADTAGGYITLKERDKRWLEYRHDLKQGLVSSSTDYECVTSIATRALAILMGYREHKKVIVVSHFNVLESLLGYQEQGIECAEYKHFTLDQVINRNTVPLHATEHE